MSKMSDKALKYQRFRIEVEQCIDGFFETWLLENYPDEIGCKDQLIEMLESKVHYEDFSLEMKKIMQEYLE